VTFADHDILDSGQFLEGQWATRVQFLGGDADLGAQAEDSTIGESRGGVDVYDSGIHGAREAARRIQVPRDDGFGVTGPVPGDVVDRFIQPTTLTAMKIEELVA
jgi:hypothetical protein